MTNDLSLDHDGAKPLEKALGEGECADLEERLAPLPKDNAGVRIGAAPTLATWLAPDGKLGMLAAHVLGPNARAVRVLLFDKTLAQNWSLTWHQDRSILVEHREGVAGFGPWAVKTGLVQVEPPLEMIQRMVTMRIHLDPVDENNAPLRIVPGSHRLGRVAKAEIAGIVERCGERACLAARGDIWLYATAIIHALGQPIRHVVAAFCRSITVAKCYPNPCAGDVYKVRYPVYTAICKSLKTLPTI